MGAASRTVEPPFWPLRTLMTLENIWQNRALVSGQSSDEALWSLRNRPTCWERSGDDGRDGLENPEASHEKRAEEIFCSALLSSVVCPSRANLESPSLRFTLDLRLAPAI